MADYYPLIARAVAGLDNSTGEARRALYERARTALVTQLRGVVPALSEADITRERLALEEAIRKVEAEAARRPRADVPHSDLVSPPSAQAEPKPRSPSPSEPALRAEPARPPGRPTGNPPPGDRPSLIEQGLKGFRDDVAETDEVGEATAPNKKPARETFGMDAPPFPEPDRMQPRFEPEGLGRAYPEAVPPAPPSARLNAARPLTGTAQLRSRLHNGIEEPHEPLQLDRGFGGTARKVIVIAALIALCVAAAFAYRERSSIAELYQSIRGTANQAARDTTQSRAKISDRIGPGGQQDSSNGTGSTPAVAQRVVLYEQQPNTTERKQYIGSVIWRTETVSPGPGIPPDLAVKADVEIPERHLRMSWTLRRNMDQTLPASHTIEIMFNVAPDFPSGGISDVPGVLMEQAEQTRGVPLTGIRVKVTNGFFLVGLSAVDTEAQRNIQLLKERPWLDIPVVYNDGNRALLAIEKGVPGDRVFAEAFAAWKQ